MINMSRLPMYFLRICLLMTLSVSCVHDDGGKPIRDGRLAWTFSHGTRVCCDACAVMVGMFFSLSYAFIFQILMLSLIQKPTEIRFGSAKVVFFILIANYFSFPSMKMTSFPSKYGSGRASLIFHTCTAPEGSLNFPMAAAISSETSPPFR